MLPDIPAVAIQWRHNRCDGVSNHQPHDCLLNRLFRRRSKKTSKFRISGVCRGIHPWPMNSSHKGPVTRKMFPFDDVIMVFQEETNWGVAVILQTYTVWNISLWLWIYSSKINLLLYRIGWSWYSEIVEMSKFSVLGLYGTCFWNCWCLSVRGRVFRDVG